jgi:chemotaxis protein CheY-P-specific phosphatase CheC
MFGMSLILNEEASSPPWDQLPPWLVVFLPIHGVSSLSVVLAANRESAALLASTMFSCDIADVDDSMQNDALCEMLNIVAGQLKSSMGLSHSLGLPSVLQGTPGNTSDHWRSATLHGEGVAISVWVAIRLDA